MGNGIFPQALTRISKTDRPAAGLEEIKPILVLDSSEAKEAILRYWKS